jgi:hypothetical protein
MCKERRNSKLYTNENILIFEILLQTHIVSGNLTFEAGGSAIPGHKTLETAVMRGKRHSRAKILGMTLESPVEGLGLPAHLVKKLHDAGYQTVGDLCAVSEHELLRNVRRLGRLSLNKIKAALAKEGLAARKIEP